MVSSFSSWLFAIVRRECLRLGRSAGLLAADSRTDEQAWLGRPDEALRLDLALRFERSRSQRRLVQQGVEPGPMVSTLKCLQGSGRRVAPKEQA